jgi:hypothetical protein
VESNLTIEQQKLVRTPAFKKWFGDWENSPQTASKVVDENGEPLVVYHGSLSQINKFKLYKKNKNINLRMGDGFYFTNALSQAKQYGKFTHPSFLKIMNMANYYDSGVENNKYIENGYDGVIADDELLIKNKKIKYDEYVVFESNQIKLADGTNTTFDGSNPNIKMNEGGSIKSKGTFKQLGSAKELGITPKIAGHDMIAICDCGEKFSYQNSKKNIVWECPECKGMKRIVIMETITLYHATNTPIKAIGIEKQTMFFTDDIDFAKYWGDEHYEDYDILEVEIPTSDIYEYEPDRPEFAITDFEQLESHPELIKGRCVHFDNVGYIVKNINEYKLR